MANPDLDLATYIESQIASLTLGVNLFAGPIRSFATSSDGYSGIPVDSVFCLKRPGLADEVFHEDVSPSAFRHLAFPSVQIFIRSSSSFQSGQSLADEIFQAVNHKPTAGYVEWKATTSEPLYVGKDDQQHHEWSINISMVVDEVVS